MLNKYLLGKLLIIEYFSHGREGRSYMNNLILFLLLYQWGNWDTERLNDLSKSTFYCDETKIEA